MRINLVLGFQAIVPPTRGGGVENLIVALARQFARAEHRVTIISRRATGFPRYEKDATDVEHLRISGGDFSHSRVLNIIKAFCHGLRLFRVIPPADVTSFHTPFAFLHAGRRQLGVTTFTIHRTPKWVVPFYRRMDRVYAGSDAVVADARRIDPKISNLKRIYNGVELPHFNPVESKVTKSGITFLYVGRFVPDKGLQALIEGFEKSLKRFPNNRLLTVGPQTAKDGADETFFGDMRAYIAARAISANVELRGPIFDREQLNQMINDSDVVCVPTITGETFSMAILEAMALGKPILTSDFGPMPEAVEHGITGFISRAGDSDSIMEAIESFSECSNQLAEMGRQARKTVEKRFTIEHVAQEYLDDFAAIASRKAMSLQT